MNRIAKRFIIYLIMASLIIVPALGTAFAYEENYNQEITSEKMTADLLLVRPVGILSMIAGTVVFFLGAYVSFVTREIV